MITDPAVKAMADAIAFDLTLLSPALDSFIIRQ